MLHAGHLASVGAQVIATAILDELAVRHGGERFKHLTHASVRLKRWGAYAGAGALVGTLLILGN